MLEMEGDEILFLMPFRLLLMPLVKIESQTTNQRTIDTLNGSIGGSSFGCIEKKME